jgi:hypothetical protein
LGQDALDEAPPDAARSTGDDQKLATISRIDLLFSQPMFACVASFHRCENWHRAWADFPSGWTSASKAKLTQRISDPTVVHKTSLDKNAYHIDYFGRGKEWEIL